MRRPAIRVLSPACRAGPAGRRGAPRRGGRGLVLVVLALVGCGGDVVEESGFHTSGRSPVDGLIGQARFAAIQELPEFLEQTALGDVFSRGTAVDLFLLDVEAFGSPVAVVLSGPGARESFAALEAAGLLHPTGVEAGRYAIDLSRMLQVPQRMSQLLAGGGPGAMMGRRAGERGLLRIDRDGSILLSPSVDLREALFALSAAAAQGGADRAGPGALLALDGRQFLRFYRATVAPYFNMALMVGSRITDASEREADAVRIALGALEEFLSQLDGVVCRSSGKGLESGRAVLRAAEGSELAEVWAAFAPAEPDPAGEAEAATAAPGSIVLEFQFDGPRLATAYDPFAARVLSRSAALEQAEERLGLVRDILRTLGGRGRLELLPESRAVWSLAPDADPQAIDRLRAAGIEIRQDRAFAGFPTTPDGSETPAFDRLPPGWSGYARISGSAGAWFSLAGVGATGRLDLEWKVENNQ